MTKTILPDQTIWIFVHIPKTAGTSFIREVSTVWFPQGRHVFSYAGFSLEEQKRRRAKLAQRTAVDEVTFVSGHDVFGLGDGIGSRVAYFTYFREPVARLVSLWFHHLYRPGEKRPGWQWLFDKYPTCEDFVRAVNPLSEYIYSFLTAEENWDFDRRLRQRLDDSNPVKQGQPLVRNLAMLTLPQEAPDIYAEMTALAYPRIESAIPLISERFDEGLAYLAHLLNKPVVQYQRQRQGQHSDERDRVLELLPELRSLHPEATSFYQSQVRRFEELTAGTARHE